MYQLAAAQQTSTVKLQAFSLRFQTEERILRVKTEGILINWSLTYVILLLIFINCAEFKTKLELNSIKMTCLAGAHFWA